MEIITKILTDSSLYTFWFYWISVVLSLYKGVVGSHYRYKLDMFNRSKIPYFPQFTIGFILGSIFFSFVPIVNTVRGTYALMEDIIFKFVDWLSKVFSYNLIKAKPSDHVESSIPTVTNEQAIEILKK